MQAMDLFADFANRTIFMRRRHPQGDVCVVVSFSVVPVISLLPVPAGIWTLALNTADRRWAGTVDPLPREISSNGEARIEIPPVSCCVYVQETK